MTATDPKRVAVIYKLTEPGGVQSCVLALIRGLNERGIVPDVLWDQAPSEALLEEAGAKAGFVHLPFHVSSRNIARLPDTLRYLAWVANVVQGDPYRSRYDCFYSFYNGFIVPKGSPHVYYLSGPPLLPQLQVPALGLRGLPIRCFQALYRVLLRSRYPAYEFHRDRHYVITSRYTARLFREAHGVSLPVVYPAIDLRGRDFETGDLQHRDTILFFSRIVDYKRPEMILELAGRFRQYRCAIMGGVPSNRRAYLASLRKRAQAADLEVHFLDNPSNRTVRDELARARFYVFPAVNEHFGMTTPEAIASGAIPFVHDSGGQQEIVPDARLRFVDSEYVGKFRALSSMPVDTLSAMRDALARHIRQYSSEAFVSKLLGYLDAA